MLLFEDEVIKGQVASVAKFSNHKVGHAIDMNIWWKDKNGLTERCLSSCIAGPNPPQFAQCFISRIYDDSTLRTGLEFQGEFHLTRKRIF